LGLGFSNRTIAQGLCKYLALIVLLQGCSKAPAPAIGDFIDNRDGKTYKTTKIGEQIWMAENLNYNINESICYDDKIKNCEEYGRLYNWETAMKACPAGWHLPRNDEWDVLFGYVGNSDALKKIDSWSPVDTWYSYMGKHLESLPAFFILSFFACSNNTEYVNTGCFLVLSGISLTLVGVYSHIVVSLTPSANAKLNGIDNNYGFSALPSGYAESSANKSLEIKKQGLWWTATEADSSDAYYRSLYYDMYNVVKRNNNKSYLLSVRCVFGS